MLPAPMDEHPTAAIPSRTSQQPIFFPFTIKTFYRSNFLFTIISQPMSSPHFSHLAAKTLKIFKISSCNGLMLCSTSDIQSFLSLLPSLPPPSRYNQCFRFLSSSSGIAWHVPILTVFSHSSARIKYNFQSFTETIITRHVYSSPVNVTKFFHNI